MLIKLAIVLFLGFILYNLSAGLYYMLKDQGKSNRTARALTWRIGLSLVLFVLLIVGRSTGVIGTNPSPITGEREPPVFASPGDES